MDTTNFYSKYYLGGNLAAHAMDAAPEWNEESHPRNSKGGSGGGRFRTSGATIEREDTLHSDDAEDGAQKKMRNALERVLKRVQKDPEGYWRTLSGFERRGIHQDVAATLSTTPQSPDDGNEKSHKMRKALERVLERVQPKLGEGGAWYPLTGQDRYDIHQDVANALD